MWKKLTFLASVCLLLATTGNAAPIVITTADGRGADTYLANDSQSGIGTNGPDTTHGAEIRMRAFRQLANTRSKTGYIRFDLGDAVGDMSGATLTFEATFLKGSGKVVQVYGLINGDGDLWDESTLTYNTAAGVIPNPPTILGNCVLDTAKVTLLGTIALPAAGAAYPVAFSSNPADLPLADFLDADTNKLVTFLFIGDDNEGEIASKEHETFNPPTLTLPNAVRGARTSAIYRSPANDANDVSRDVVLSWAPGVFAATHNVYLGTDSEAVINGAASALVSSGNDANTYDPPGHLEFSQAYYWRVDEVNSAPDFTVYPGKVWSFTVEPYSYPITNITATASSSNPGTGPEKTIDGSGLNDADQHSMELTDTWLSGKNMPQPVWIQYEFDRAYKLDELWVWNSNQMLEATFGFGVKDVTVECSEDGENWTTFGDLEFAQAPGAETYTPEAIDLGGAVAKFVKLTVKSNWGGVFDQYGLGEVRFFYVPVRPREPKPADGATDPAVDAMLSWRSGREAAQHQVWFGEDQQAVEDGTVAAETVSTTSYDPGPMTFGTTYYWKVAEVNEAEIPSAWEGDLWSFTTAEYAVLDDFEGYTDDIEAGQTIWQTWLDGQTNNTGSTVGYWEAPFAEQTIVRGGNQSMPLDYNNVNSPYYSEAERSFDPPQDWTVSGADTLSLYVRGNPVAFVETPEGAVTMSAAGTDIFGTADEFRFAYKPLAGDVTIVARVDRIDDADPWAMAGVMVRENLDPGARFAAVFATAGNGVRFRTRTLAAGSAASDTAVATPEQTALQVPVWIKLQRSGSNVSCFYSTDGVAWTAMSWNPQAVSMSGTVYVGLAVTSHSPNVYTIAEYSNISAPGVAGSWQVAEIGVAQPANDPSQLYMVVQDSSNKSAVAVHPDPAITNVTEWTQWKIPLSSLAGVNLRRVQKIYLGVGDRNNPQRDGAGLLYIDDIGFGHPAAGSQ